MKRPKKRVSASSNSYKWGTYGWKLILIGICSVFLVALFVVSFFDYIWVSIVPNGYVRTLGTVSHAYCRSEDISFIDQSGHIHTIQYGPFYLGRLCNADPEGSKRMVAYNPQHPNSNIKIPDQAGKLEAFITFALIVIIVSTTGKFILNAVKRIL